jgi:hypothetical protein
MFEQRDEYAASQARGLGCGFWAIWTLATTFGGFLGQLAGQGLARVLLPADADLATVMLVGVPIGAVLGVAVGSFQGLVLMRYLRAAGVRDWVLASMAGGVLRWSVLGPVSALWTLSLNSGFAQCNALIPLALFGAASGAAFGLPQTFVFSRHLRRGIEMERWAWVLANAAGGVFYLPLVMLSGWTGSAVVAMSGQVTDDRFAIALTAMTLNWLFVGIITGLPLRDRLRDATAPTHLNFEA